MERAQLKRHRLVLGAWVLAVLAGCGGGSGPAGDQVEAPVSILYETARVTIRTDGGVEPVLPTVVGDMPTEWTVEPPLPAGLHLTAAGGIAGMATEPYPRTSHTVTGINEAGAATTTITIEVIWSEFKSLERKRFLTDADSRHFLERTHFGFSQPHHDALQVQGLEAYVADMLFFEDTTALELEAEAHFANSFNSEGLYPLWADMTQWWLHIMQHTENPFQEVLAFHWHNHFATSSLRLYFNQLRWFQDHVNLWRHDGAGNLRDLLLRMSRDWTMMIWLDGAQNDAGEGKEPNENFAREFFELYCLGVDVVYTQADVEAAARAFSGYRLSYYFDENNRFQWIIGFEHERHDHHEKELFGQLLPAQAEGPTETDEYDLVVDLTLGLTDPESGAPRVGQWIIRNLLQHFCYDDPPARIVNELAIQLRNEGWELRPVLQRLFVSETFFSPEARDGRIKGPADLLLGFMRATGLEIPADLVEPELVVMKHVPGQPPSVNGWPGAGEWLSAQGMVNTANMIQTITDTEMAAQHDAGQFALDLLPTLDATAGQTVDALALRLQIDLDESARTRLIEFLNTKRDASGETVSAPWEPSDVLGTEERVRQLLWVLAQHPSYLVR